MSTPTARLVDLLAANRSDGRGGITSVCTAHPVAIGAALELARERGQLALIEATCNQVNQFGGYTGMHPADFVRLVRDAGADLAQTVLGGDHLGPQPWRSESGDAAMAKAEEMVAEYVAAGFTKIHLDCSMRCADDPDVLPEGTIATRAARLARAAEAARNNDQPLCYVIGTEVPPPGGMGAGHAIEPTAPAAVAVTIQAHRRAFAAAGAEAAFAKVVAIVVQPGVEFGNEDVVHFDAAAAAPLARAVATLPDGMVYEAHSTDYQRPAAYAGLVRSHFGILKVGPAATFALREALFALEAIETELVEPDARSRLSPIVEAVMFAHPQQWQGHYSGSAQQQHYLRRFSLSDRIRYFWTDPAIAGAVAKLRANLQRTGLPLTLVSQHFPQHFEAVRDGRAAATADSLCRANIKSALVPYADATAL
ncbi:MAG: class II D-tagatose-bisphosphate aldolase, non-catalytic subunit [Devosia sp.]